MSEPLTNLRNEVLYYYLTCEVGKLVWEDLLPIEFSSYLTDQIDKLPVHDAERLCYSLSRFYRNNGIYETLQKDLIWTKQENVSIDKLYMPDINAKVAPYAQVVDNNIARFVAALQATLDDKAKEDLHEFRLNPNRQLHRRTLICVPNNLGLFVLDGSHRAIALALRGITKFTCYIGNKNDSSEHSA